MEAFKRLEAIAAALPLANIDTDQIIPKQYLKTVTRDGLGKGLFHDMRYDGAGAERPDFVLNTAEGRRAGILIAGDNFGCGSSREHAPWALADFGIRCVIAPGFAEIFYGNCFQNGLAPIVLKASEVASLLDTLNEGVGSLIVDLEAQQVIVPSGQAFSFSIDPGRRAALLSGLDAIDDTLGHGHLIAAYEQARERARPWLAARRGPQELSAAP